MTRRPVAPSARIAPEALVLTAIASAQTGGALATKLFDRVGPPGAVLLRLVLASAVLAALRRPAVRGRDRSDLALIGAFGVAFAAMNLTFYLALDRIPLGVAVTVEFVGPLGVALAGSRRPIDGLWALLAGGGVVLLTSAGGRVGLAGVLLALAAGACWAAYILLSKAVGRRFDGNTGLVGAMVIAAVIALPWGIASGGRELLSPPVLALGLGVGMLSTAIPYSLELAALRRLPTRVFGVLMSLEPAMAALAGFLIIGQSLGHRALLALAMVSAASVGSTVAHRRQASPVPVID
ncbi:MAG: EamA family transporter [Frankiaceae bacterium]